MTFDLTPNPSPSTPIFFPGEGSSVYCETIVWQTACLRAKNSLRVKEVQRREPVAVSKRSDLGEERFSGASTISSNEFCLP